MLPPSSASPRKNPEQVAGQKAGPCAGDAAGWDDEDPLPRKLTAEEAEAFRGQRSAPSPWRVVLVQVEAGVVIAGLLGLVFGLPALWSALYGAATAVVPGAPAAYFSTLPIKAIVRDLRAGGLPAGVSNTAGTFVCNHVFYALMHRLALQGGAVRGGFVHVPYLPEQAARHPGAPSMALDTQAQALRTLVRTALTVREDVRETAGQLH